MSDTGYGNSTQNKRNRRIDLNIMNTRRFTIMLLAAAMVVAGPLVVPSSSEASEVSPNASHQNGKITVEGTATIYGHWACEGQAIVKAIPGEALEPVSGFPGGVQKTLVSVTVHDIECGDRTMNKHLRKALKEKDHPKIYFETDKYTLLDNSSTVKSYGELTIAGVTRPVELNATLTALPQGGVRVVGKVDIKMPDYKVKPPSLLFGTLKVANDVSVKFDTTIQPPDQLQQISASMNIQ